MIRCDTKEEAKELYVLLKILKNICSKSGIEILIDDKKVNNNNIISSAEELIDYIQHKIN